MTATEHAKDTNAAAPNHEAKLWLGIVVGISVGIGISLSRHGKSRRDTARTVTNPDTNRATGRDPNIATEPPAGFAEAATPGLSAPARHASQESRTVMESANHLWASGRKLAGS